MSRKTRPLLRRLLSQDGTDVLLELHWAEWDEGWDRYHVDFVGLPLAELLRIENECDPRDVLYVYEKTDGTRIPYASVSANYHEDQCLLLAKGEGYYPTERHPFLNRLRVLLGLKPHRVEQDRAPISWRRVRKSKVLAEVRSGNPAAILMALSEAYRHSRANDVAWIVPLLLDSAQSDEPLIRESAISGLGELARLHGFSSATVEDTVRRATEDCNPAVRRAAHAALDVMCRFAR